MYNANIIATIATITAATVNPLHHRACRRMTFDNADELQKIKDNYPEAEIILRIMADDSQSVCKFNSKFAAAKDDHPLLLERARELGLNVVGVSFHVGSGCSSAAPFADAVYRARMAFDLYESITIPPAF